jgi:hypothetical protein
MPGQTAIYKLPYPLSTEAADGPLGFRQLAEATEATVLVPCGTANFVQAAPPGNSFTGWGFTGQAADPSGTISVGTDRFTLNKAGVYLMTLYQSAGVGFTAEWRTGAGYVLGAAYVSGADNRLSLTAVLPNAAVNDTVQPYFFFFGPITGNAGGGSAGCRVTYLGARA